jgi:hypothetical protein
MNTKEYYYLENDKPIGPMGLVELLEIIDRHTMVWREGINWSLAFEIDELKKFFPEVVITSNTKQKTEYYYLENNKSVGPLDLAELLETIDRETMVWRVGIDWTIACELDELQKYFPAIIKTHSPVNKPLISKPPIVTKPSPQEINITTHSESSIVSSQTKVIENEVAKLPKSIKPEVVIPTSLTSPQMANTPSKQPIKSSKVSVSNIVSSLAQNKNDSQVGNDKKNINNQQDAIRSILTNLYEELKKVRATTSGCLYITPNINIKKFNKLKQKIGNIIDVDSNCLIHSDDTLFGSGEEGFYATNDTFAWRRSFMKPTYVKWNEIDCFKIGIKKNEIVLKKIEGSEYIIVIVMLPFPKLFADAFNELLKILK